MPGQTPQAEGLLVCEQTSDTPPHLSRHRSVVGHDPDMPAKVGKPRFNPNPFKGPRVTLAGRVQPETRERAQEAARRLGLSTSDYLEKLVSEAPMPDEQPVEHQGLLSA